MFHKRYGTGPQAFVGLHGWSGDHRTFEPLLRFMPPEASFYSLDLPGCGRSPKPSSLAFDAVCETIAEAIRSLGPERVTLVGNCSGAIFGLGAMPWMADRIERLVLIDPFAYAPLYFRLFVVPGFGKLAYASTFANPLGRWLTNRSLKKHRTEATDLTESFARIDHGVAYRYLELLTGIESIDPFVWIRQPIEIVHGARTFAAVRASIGMWRGIWPQARVFELTGAGHLPILEATEPLARIIFHLCPNDSSISSAVTASPSSTH